MIEGTAKRMLVVAALALCLPTVAWAGPLGDGGHRGGCGGKKFENCACVKADGEGHFGRMAAILQLDDTQRQQVAAIVAAERAQAAPLAEQMREERQALRQVIHSGSAQETEIRAQVAAQSEIKAELMILRADAWKKISALLTPEQRALAAEKFAMGEEGHAGGRGKKGHGCQGGERQ